MTESIEVHGLNCDCEECSTPLGVLVARRGFKCPDCGHQHTGERFAYICIGCPCERRPDWTKADAAVARTSVEG